LNDVVAEGWVIERGPITLATTGAEEDGELPEPGQRSRVIIDELVNWD
jgi:hypothetical protein